MPRALLSVSCKDGIVEFARELIKLGFSIISSGGTAAVLRAAGVPVTDLSDVIGPPLFGHRWATLASEVYQPILSRNLPEDDALLARLGLECTDLVCVDLYPFEDKAADPKLTEEEKREFIDVGGPTLLRAAAKGPRIVISSPEQRGEVLVWLAAGKPDEAKFTRKLASRARYEALKHDLAVLKYFGDGEYDGTVGRKVLDFKYGENPSQKGALYEDESATRTDTHASGLLRAVKDARHRLGYVGATDVGRLLTTMTHIGAVCRVNAVPAPCIVVVVKHGNPCGAVIRDNAKAALDAVVSCNEQAVFGGSLMTNFAIGAAEAETLRKRRVRDRHSGAESLLMIDVVIAPSFSEEALAVLKPKTPGSTKWNAVPFTALAGPLDDPTADALDYVRRLDYIRGGFLAQTNYTNVLTFVDPTLEFVGGGLPPFEVRRDLALAWAVCATSNSNTTTIARDGMLLGNGCGRMDRVGSCHLAITDAGDAGHRLEESVAVTDGFFPKDDGPSALFQAGVTTILAPSGSKEDNAIRSFCRNQGIRLILAPNGRCFAQHHA
ncbi:hypothetical protein HY633_04685 [Candidatus Uhrbacteria bacterium]|nr:hypothetical protein [Candidatus Uhrbacteria bacterium]